MVFLFTICCGTASFELMSRRDFALAWVIMMSQRSLMPLTVFGVALPSM
ncbi:MAG TPA: hypothetical protein VG963_04045 [Polyangiaceae bacterium]|nr:hypothetical protein [Polyangiaceae bacterium]